jgi:integrase
MPRLWNNHVPSYCRHSASGQALVTLDGRDIYLGRHGTAKSRAEYDRLIAEWLAAGRRLPVDPQAVTVAEIFAAFRRHAKTYYRSAEGAVSTEFRNISEAMRPVLKLYGRSPAIEFGPLRLKTVIQDMITAGHVRTAINRNLSRIKSVFKWAVGNELIPASVHHGLSAISGLRAGRSEAKESDRVLPVSQADVDATLARLSPTVGAVVRIQLLTGARPGEICAMRTADIDTSSPVWAYKPQHHKTEHHGHQRTIHIGPKAQEVLLPFLKPLNAEAYIFSPKVAEAERRAALHEARKSPLSCGNVPGSNRQAKPKRQPGDQYTVETYRRAIARACKAAGVKHWFPHRLRHSAATGIRRQFGLEAARTALGHKTVAVTEIYAERDSARAAEIAGAVG